MRVPGFSRLYAGLLLGRMAGSMLFVALILFVLERYHSPQLAGATAFMAALPGIIVSPLAGALLDRYGRARLVVLDYAVAALALGLIASLSALNLLASPLLLAIVAVASVTNPLSWAGARSRFRSSRRGTCGNAPTVLTAAGTSSRRSLHRRWPTLVGLFGGEWALAASGAVYVAAAVVMVRLPEPRSAAAQVGSVLQNAWLGLVYTLRNSTLRGLALTLSVYNVGNGLLAIAIPVLVLGRLHSGPSAVGLLWGAMGGAGLASALVAGRFSSQGRERWLMAGPILVAAVATALIPLANNIWVVAAAIVLLGLATGPFDIGLFTLRQRRTDPAWFGRAFAVSMSLNSVGNPIGSALAGPLVAVSLNVAIWAAVAATLASLLIVLVAIPGRDAMRGSPIGS